MVILFLNHHIGTFHTHDLTSVYVCEGGRGTAKIDKI